jgi:hypothetical protein
MVVKFDLETLQLDVPNTFVHADIDETVYMWIPPNYGKPNKVVQLNKALYNLSVRGFRPSYLIGAR